MAFFIPKRIPKSKLMLLKLGLTSLFLGINFIVWAFSKDNLSYESIYGTSPTEVQAGVQTAREKAFDLARILDRGRFQGELIRNVIVFNNEDNEFYVVATLGNGQSLKMTMELLKQATNQGSLFLENNRILVFPNPRLNDFVVFDKKAFYNQALRTKYYRRTFPAFHPMEGLTYIEAVKNFRYIPKATEPFVFDFINGGHIALNNFGAYQALANNLLLHELANPNLPLVQTPFYVTKIASFDKVPYDLNIKEEPNIKPFGLLLTFSSPLPEAWSEKYFPILLEKSKKDGFDVNIILPNLSLARSYDLAKLPKIEYLGNWQLLKNYQDRFAVLRSHLLSKNLDESNFLSYPPQVFLHPDRQNLFIIFFQDLNKTIDYAALEQANQLIGLRERALVGTLPILGGEQHSEFIFEYNAAVKQYNAALAGNDWALRKVALQKAIQSFRSAGHYAKNDTDLNQVLSAIEKARVRILQSIYMGELYPYINERNFSDNNKTESIFAELVQYTSKPEENDYILNDLKSLIDANQKVILLQTGTQGVTSYTATDVAKFKGIIARLESQIAAIRLPLGPVQSLKAKLGAEIAQVKLKFQTP